MDDFLSSFGWLVKKAAREYFPRGKMRQNNTMPPSARIAQPL